MFRDVIAFQVVTGRQPRPGSGAQQGIGLLAETAARLHNEGDEASVVKGAVRLLRLDDGGEALEVGSQRGRDQRLQPLAAETRVEGGHDVCQASKHTSERERVRKRARRAPRRDGEVHGGAAHLAAHEGVEHLRQRVRDGEGDRRAPRPQRGHLHGASRGEALLREEG